VHTHGQLLLGDARCAVRRGCVSRLRMEASAVKAEEVRARKRARSSAPNEAAAADEPHRPANYVLRYTCEGHDNSLSSLKFSPNGKWLASACEPRPFPRPSPRHHPRARAGSGRPLLQHHCAD